VSVYVTDTHPLVWYATGKHRQLSHKVLRAFHAASGAAALIYVPVFVLWEIAMLLKVGRIALQEPYGDLPRLRSMYACSPKRTIIRFPIPSIA
jgi:PIN domain nuclease of toxin-antitoxin system